MNDQNSSKSTSKTAVEADDFRRNLVRTPSLPPNIGRREEEEEEGNQERHGDKRVSKLNKKVLVQPRELHLGKKEGPQERERNGRKSKTKGQSVAQPSKNLLVRTRTLPTSIRNVEMNQVQEESNGRISKSSCQGSLNLADILPPRHNKVLFHIFFKE